MFISISSVSESKIRNWIEESVKENTDFNVFFSDYSKVKYGDWDQLITKEPPQLIEGSYLLVFKITLFLPVALNSGS